MNYTNPARTIPISSWTGQQRQRSLVSKPPEQASKQSTNWDGHQTTAASTERIRNKGFIVRLTRMGFVYAIPRPPSDGMIIEICALSSSCGDQRHCCPIPSLLDLDVVVPRRLSLPHFRTEVQSRCIQANVHRIPFRAGAHILLPSLLTCPHIIQDDPGSGPGLVIHSDQESAASRPKTRLSSPQQK